MISKDQMFDQILEVDPAFTPQWEQFLREWENEDKPLYLALGQWAQHIIERFRRDDLDRMDAVFSIVEQWHLHGDAYVREAATIGFLESLQNWLGGQKPSRSDRGVIAAIEGYLGPESLRWWKKLYRFWDGETKALRSDT